MKISGASTKPYYKFNEAAWLNLADALHLVSRAATHVYAARCPEHWQGHEHLTTADKEAINILDYAARGIRRQIRGH